MFNPWFPEFSVHPTTMVGSCWFIITVVMTIVFDFDDGDDDDDGDEIIIHNDL